MAKNALVKRRTPADGVQHDIYVSSLRRFTNEARERADRTHDRRHNLNWYGKTLLAIAEGGLTLNKEQLAALLTFGRSKGRNRRPPSNK
jgi:hypothetical protein